MPVERMPIFGAGEGETRGRASDSLTRSASAGSRIYPRALRAFVRVFVRVALRIHLYIHSVHPSIRTFMSAHILTAGSLTLDCRRPVPGGAHIMGVLNVTPDSFSDGGLYLDADRALARAKVMADEGAIIIDVGGASSRPKGAAYGEGAPLLSAEEECKRILPVIEKLARHLPGVWISVDTFRSEVASAALAAGAHMLNDITALRFGPRMAQVAAEADVPLVVMHSVGTPGNMPHIAASNDILSEVRLALSAALETARSAGCRQLVVDPGFGFGKTTADNLLLMGRADCFLELGHPVLIGVSRKSSIARAAVGEAVPADDLPPPVERLPGSLAVTGIAVQAGASIVRTHDVAATRQFLNVLQATIQSADGQN